MKLITLWEPWSTLMAIGAKKIETRAWGTPYRGPVAIHSAKGGTTGQDTFDTCAAEPFLSVLKSARILTAGMSNRQISAAFPRGQIIAVGDLVDCLRTESYLCMPGVFDDYRDFDTPQERAFGNYEPGRFGLIFQNVRRLHAPIPFKSRQGKLLDISGDTITAIKAAL